MQNNPYPLQGTCAEAKPIWIVLAATPKMIAEAPTNSHTRRVCQCPMDILVKKICCTRRVPKLCGRIERSSSDNKGRGRNTHIRCPQVIAAAIIVEVEIWWCCFACFSLCSWLRRSSRNTLVIPKPQMKIFLCLAWKHSKQLQHVPKAKDIWGNENENEKSKEHDRCGRRN